MTGLEKRRRNTCTKVKRADETPRVAQRENRERGWREGERVEMTPKKERKTLKVEAAVVLLERTGDGEQVRKSEAETC